MTYDPDLPYDAETQRIKSDRAALCRTMQLDNGATVADWLGTASTAASVAAMYLMDVRSGVAGSGKLLEARAQLMQALEETDAVLARLA